jgi:hypothetical protein
MTHPDADVPLTRLSQSRPLAICKHCRGIRLDAGTDSMRPSDLRRSALGWPCSANSVRPTTMCSPAWNCGSAGGLHTTGRRRFGGLSNETRRCSRHSATKQPRSAAACGVPKVGAALRAGRIELSTAAHGPPAQPNATSASTSTYAG